MGTVTSARPGTLRAPLGRCSADSRYRRKVPTPFQGMSILRVDPGFRFASRWAKFLRRFAALEPLVGARERAAAACRAPTRVIRFALLVANS